jgi:hypothetical protein
MIPTNRNIGGWPKSIGKEIIYWQYQKVYQQAKWCQKVERY